VGEKGEGDEYGIGNPEGYATRQVAELFGSEIVMMPARKTSRPGGEVVIEKTLALGWEPKHKLEEYIEDIKKQKNKHG
jgi:UDP-glucose 4-epimerase